MIEYELLNGGKVKAYNDYFQGKKAAEKEKLLLAEYGDVYGSKYSYCYFNETGSRNDDEKIITYYRFNEKGKPEPITEEELRKLLFY